MVSEISAIIYTFKLLPSLIKKIYINFKEKGSLNDITPLKRDVVYLHLTWCHSFNKNNVQFSEILQICTHLSYNQGKIPRNVHKGFQ